MARKRRRKIVKAKDDAEILAYLGTFTVRKTMIRETVKRYGLRPTARALGVSPAQLSNIPTRGISETLNGRLIELELIARPKKRHRLHYEGGTGEAGARRVRLVEEMLADGGFVNLTEMVDMFYEQWKGL